MIILKRRNQPRYYIFEDEAQAAREAERKRKNGRLTEPVVLKCSHGLRAGFKIKNKVGGIIKLYKACALCARKII